MGRVVTQETGAKNDFQRKLLFSNQLSDYGPTKVSVYSSRILSIRSV